MSFFSRTILSMRKEIIYVFIDSQNLYKGVKNLGWRINYKKLYILLTRKYQAQKIFYFIGYLSKNNYVYEDLKDIGYILIFKPTMEIKTKDSTQIKGNVDGELILNAMIEYSSYDKAIIVSGDGDYHCLISYLDKNNKLYKIIVPDGRRYSFLLRKFSPHIVDINLHKKDISD